MLIVLLVILGVTVANTAAILVGARRTGVVPMPSSIRVRRLIVSILSNYSHARTITDLGSAWGGLARRIARAFSDCEVEAVELSRLPILLSRTAAFALRLTNIHHRRADIYRTRLRDNQAYVCFLSGPGMIRLRERFEQDLPTGGVLVSAVFAVPGWTPARVEHATDLFRSTVYVYEF